MSRKPHSQPNQRNSEGQASTNGVDSSQLPRKPIRKVALTLREGERQALLAQLARADVSVRYARRVRVVLLSDEGLKGVEIAQRLELSVGQVSRIRKAFQHRGLSSLADKPHPGRRDHAVTRETVAQILRIAASPPPHGRKRWSTRLIAAMVALTSATVAKVLRRVNGLNAGSGDEGPPPPPKSRPSSHNLDAMSLPQP